MRSMVFGSVCKKTKIIAIYMELKMATNYLHGFYEINKCFSQFNLTHF